MNRTNSCLLALTILSGCNVNETIKRNDDLYARPGALDLPLTEIYEKYQYKFLQKYRITHEWPSSAGSCKYGGRPTLGADRGLKGEFFSVPEIYEADGHTWQAGTMSFEEYKRTRYIHPTYPAAPPTFDDYAYYLSFDRYVRSVKRINPVVYDKKTGKRIEGASEEIEGGLQVLCQQSWYATQHGLSMFLRKWSVDQYIAWLQANAPQPGKVSHQRRGAQNWTVLEFQLEPQSKDGASSGPYQFWMLPIGETGYTFLLRLGANQESLKHSETHIRMQKAFFHLIDSVQIDPI